MKKSQKEQIKAITEIMGKSSDIPDYRFKIGKHSNRSLEFVFKHDKNYLKWIYMNVDNLPKRVEEFIKEKVLH